MATAAEAPAPPGRFTPIPEHFEGDLELLMWWRLDRAEESLLRGDPEARASHQAGWRWAYFRWLSQGGTAHEYPG